MEEPCFKFEFWLRLSTPRILKYFQSSTFFHFKQFSFVVSFVYLNGERCNNLSQWLINIQIHPQSNEFPTSSSFSIPTQYQFMNLTAPPVATGRWETRIRMELRNRSFASDNIEGDTMNDPSTLEGKSGECHSVSTFPVLCTMSS